MEVVLGKEYLVKNEKDCVLVLVTSINGDSFDGSITYGYSIVDSTIINYNKEEQEEQEKYADAYSELCEFLYTVDRYEEDLDKYVEQFIEESDLDIDFSEFADIASWDRIDSDKQVSKTFLQEDVIYKCDKAGEKTRIPFTSSISKDQVSLIMNSGFYLVDPFHYDSAIMHVDSEGVYYNVYDMIAICSRVNVSFDPNDIVINGIIQQINNVRAYTEEYVPIHFLMDHTGPEFEAEEYGHILTINGEYFCMI